MNSYVKVFRSPLLPSLLSPPSAPLFSCVSPLCSTHLASPLPSPLFSPLFLPLAPPPPSCPLSPLFSSPPSPLSSPLLPLSPLLLCLLHLYFISFFFASVFPLQISPTHTLTRHMHVLLFPSPPKHILHAFFGFCFFFYFVQTLFLCVCVW